MTMVFDICKPISNYSPDPGQTPSLPGLPAWRIAVFIPAVRTSISNVVLKAQALILGIAWERKDPLLEHKAVVTISSSLPHCRSSVGGAA